MFAPFFLFAALLSADAQPPKPRVTLVASNFEAPEVRDVGYSALAGYAAERHVARTVETELAMREVKTVSRGSATELCANDSTDFILYVAAMTGLAPGPTPGIIPSTTGRVRLAQDGTAIVSARLLKCPGIVAASEVSTGSLPHEVNPSMAALFNALGEQTAYKIVNGVRGTSGDVAAGSPVTRRRISIIETSMNNTDERFIAEQQVVHAVEAGLNLTEVTTVANGSVASLCAGNATDYVLSVQANVAPDYTVVTTTPPTAPGPTPSFLVASKPAPQISAALLRCPGTLIATSLHRAWTSPNDATPPIHDPGYSHIALDVANDIIAKL